MIEIIQNGYECSYEMRLFAGMFFAEKEDAVIMQNFSYEDGKINTYTHIVFEGRSYFEDYYFDFDIEGKSDKLIKKIFIVIVKTKEL